MAIDTKNWNAEGRAMNLETSSILEGIIDRDEEGAPFPEDERDPEMAEAVLAEVVALNGRGAWQEARERFDPAHVPFIPQMEATELQLTAVAILGPDAFLVRRGDATDEGPVVHLHDGEVRELAGVVGFALSSDRQKLALATSEGVVVSAGLTGGRLGSLAWPEGDPIRPHTFSVSNDGKTVVLANDDDGIWLGRVDSSKRGNWVKLAPRPSLIEGVDDDDAIDVLHAALSPDGQFVALGWQDAPGHVIERIGDGLAIERWGIVQPVSDYPYHALFTSDSRWILSNSRHLQGGVTTASRLESIRGLDDALPDDAHKVDEYLRAYGMVVLPADVAPGQNEPIIWVGGQGWSHAAPISGGKPAFTHLFGSSLYAFDYDPVSRRAAVASASGMLHIVDPFARDQVGRAAGYKPRRELYRWIFWDTLDRPIRW